MPMTEYSTSSVARTRFPDWQRDPSGSWSRTWHLTLDSQCADVGRVFDFSDEAQSVAVRVESAMTVTMRTSTTADPMSDELFYFAAYRALRAVHEQVGSIATIEGLPRTAYQPFRDSGHE